MYPLIYDINRAICEKNQPTKPKYDCSNVEFAFLAYLSYISFVLCFGVSAIKTLHFLIHVLSAVCKKKKNVIYQFRYWTNPNFLDQNSNID